MMEIMLILLFVVVFMFLPFVFGLLCRLIGTGIVVFIIWALWLLYESGIFELYK
jgi:hypothetical protein